MHKCIMMIMMLIKMIRMKLVERIKCKEINLMMTMKKLTGLTFPAQVKEGSEQKLLILYYFQLI